MAIIVAGTLMAVALCGKWMAAFLTQVVFRYSNAQRQLIFGLSSSHAAATLAVILVGYNAGILDENILNGTIILILGTCIVASIATEKAARKIIVESKDEKIDLIKRNGVAYEHILLPFANVENIEKLLELTIFIKNKKSTNPLSILSVVSNDHESESNIIKARSKLGEFVKQASASEIKVNIITTIDHNAASGISRISKEIMADIIVLGWPQRSGFIDKLLGEKVDSILTSTNKTAFICHLEHPLFMHKRIVITAPPLAEHENGFGVWFAKMTQLAHELRIPVVLYCNDETKKASERLLSKLRQKAFINIQPFALWDDFLILARDIRIDDLIVLVSARKGATSYMGILEKLPSKLEKYFPVNSMLIIYPQQFDEGAKGAFFKNLF
jgi:hypothetical protein